MGLFVCLFVFYFGFFCVFFLSLFVVVWVVFFFFLFGFFILQAYGSMSMQLKDKDCYPWVFLSKRVASITYVFSMLLALIQNQDFNTHGH